MKRFLSILTCLLLLTAFLSLSVSANAPGPNVDGSYVTNPTTAVILIVISAIGIIFTCLTEWLVSIPFGLRGIYDTLIIATNFVTQVVMRVLQLGLFYMNPHEINPFLWYLICVIVLEFLVYVVEYLIYRRKMHIVSAKKCLLYTITANTVSAVGGVLLLMIII